MVVQLQQYEGLRNARNQCGGIIGIIVRETKGSTMFDLIIYCEIR